MCLRSVRSPKEQSGGGRGERGSCFNSLMGQTEREGGPQYRHRDHLYIYVTMVGSVARAFGWDCGQVCTGEMYAGAQLLTGTSGASATHHTPQPNTSTKHCPRRACRMSHHAITNATHPCLRSSLSHSRTRARFRYYRPECSWPHWRCSRGCLRTRKGNIRRVLA